MKNLSCQSINFDLTTKKILRYKMMLMLINIANISYMYIMPLAISSFIPLSLPIVCIQSI